MERVEILTPDGICPSYVFRPEGAGPFPPVLVYMDGVGIRPAMQAVGARLATHGYLALLPDLFYRAGPYEPMDAMTAFTDPAQRDRLRTKFHAHISPEKVMSDTGAFLDFLAAHPDAKRGKVGVTGYCMGGVMALTAAGTYPDRIAVSASFHPGGLATDAPNSPHLLAAQMRARVYVAAAMEDPSFPDAMKARLDAALTEAGVDHRVETYPARHGFVPTDTPVHDAAAAERHYAELTKLLGETLG